MGACSGDCSSASSSSSTRSSDAIPDWNVAAIDAMRDSGSENWREYWIIAWTSPMLIAPLAMRSPPTTATSTYWMFPMNIVAGWMRLETNCAPKLARKRSSLSARKRASTSRWRPKLFTIAWPVKTSSACALTEPVPRHCSRKRGRARRPMTPISPIVAGTVTIATTARTGEMRNIITATPTRVSRAVTIELTVCCRLWARLSMSLVTRLRRSPRCWRST